MRRLIFIFALLLASAPLLADPQVPEADGFINDRAALLSDRQVRRLEVKAREYREQSGYEIAVLIVPSLENRSLEDFAHDVFQTWGIGSADGDNGVLFLVALEERAARIEVGYGLEGELTDIECGRLVSKHSPMARAFRERDYAGGVSAVIDGIKQAIGGDYNPVRPRNVSQDSGGWMVLVVAAFIFFVIVMTFRRRIAEFQRFGEIYGGRWKDGSRSSSGSSSSGFTWGGGSGFGGGGGSFGGGSSGGGGASGGW